MTCRGESQSNILTFCNNIERKPSSSVGRRLMAQQQEAGYLRSKFTVIAISPRGHVEWLYFFKNLIFHRVVTKFQISQRWMVAAWEQKRGDEWQRQMLVISISMGFYITQKRFVSFWLLHWKGVGGGGWGGSAGARVERKDTSVSVTWWNVCVKSSRKQ